MLCFARRADCSVQLPQSYVRIHSPQCLIHNGNCTIKWVSTTYDDYILLTIGTNIWDKIVRLLFLLSIFIKTSLLSFKLRIGVSGRPGACYPPGVTVENGESRLRVFDKLRLIKLRGADVSDIFVLTIIISQYLISGFKLFKYTFHHLSSFELFLIL